MPPPRLHSTPARDQGLTVGASGHQPAVHACSVFPSTGLLARPCHSPNTEAPAGSAADTQRKQEYRIAWNPCTQRPCVHLTPRCPTNEACQSVPILSLRDQGPAEAQVMGRISPEALLQPLPPSAEEPPCFHQGEPPFALPVGLDGREMEPPQQPSGQAGTHSVLRLMQTC